MVEKPPHDFRLTSVEDSIKHLTDNIIPAIHSAVDVIKQEVATLTSNGSAQAQAMKAVIEQQKISAEQQNEAFNKFKEQQNFALDKFSLIIEKQREDHKQSMAEQGENHKKAMAEQENRWRAENEKITANAVAMLQDVILKGITRKFMDWLLTFAFGTALAALGWMVSKIGLK